MKTFSKDFLALMEMAVSVVVVVVVVVAASSWSFLILTFTVRRIPLWEQPTRTEMYRYV